MAQLPPKAPTMAQKWPEFGYQTQSNNWINDFTGFSSAKRSSHRRSGSDPVAFVESPLSNDCNDGDNAFERLDDEQLCSMFSDEFAANVYDNEERKMTVRMKSEPVEDGGDGEREPESGEGRVDFSGDGGTIVDPKRVKRILANRQSAQRSRIRKLHYISELERSVTTLQTEVSTLSPRVAFLDHQRLILNVDNSSLKQRIAALAQDKIFKDAHQEALKKELERLRRVYHEQNMNKTDNMTTTATTTTTTTTTGSPMTSSPPPPPPPSSLNGTDG